MKTKLLILFIFAYNFLLAQDLDLPPIPDSLALDAHIVIRLYDTEIELKDINKCVIKFRIIYTVLDGEGKDKALFFSNYDKNIKLDIGKFMVFGPDEKLVGKVKNSDILDYPAHPEAYNFSDDRIKVFKPDFPAYPYTVEYNYSMDCDNSISYLNWFPIQDPEISLQKATLVLLNPNNIDYYKKENNIVGIQGGETGNNSSVKWECRNIRAQHEEIFDNDQLEDLPNVILMPQRIKYYNSEGFTKTWKDFGQWSYNLFENRDKLDEKEIQKIKDLTSSTQDTIVKIKLIYEYLQSKTRYVNIKFGIGGFQPLKADVVAETGYGDCKALSNYLKALLSVIGIKANLCLVSAGSEPDTLFKDFPNFFYFNHVITNVPINKDTMWFESTYNLMPFGFLGDFTDDREALMLTPNGGIFVHTLKYSAEQNTKSIYAHLTIDSTGNATGDIISKYKCLEYNQILPILNEGHEEQKKWLYSNSILPSLEISSFNIKNDKKTIPQATINQSIVSKNYCTYSGNYLILPLNKLDITDVIPKLTKARKHDITILRGFERYDTLVYSFPADFSVSSLPKHEIKNSEFGYYEQNVTLDANVITLIRKFRMNQGKYSPEKYNDLYAFLNYCYKSDSVKVLLNTKK